MSHELSKHVLKFLFEAPAAADKIVYFLLFIPVLSSTHIAYSSGNCVAFQQFYRQNKLSLLRLENCCPGS